MSDTLPVLTTTKPRLGSNYWRLFSAQTISNFGDGLTAVAYPWLASAITRDPLHIALIAVATRLPWFLFTLPAGAITDRVDRQRLIVWMNILQLLITLLVALAVLAGQSDFAGPEEIAAGTASPPDSAGWYLALLYTTALIFGCAEVLRDNASQTLMPAIVDSRLLEKANGRLWGTEMVMQSFVGTPAGGFLIGIAFALPFFVDAGTFAIAAGLMALLAGTFIAEGRESDPGSMLAQIKEGVRWLWKHSLLRTLAIFLGVMNAMTMLAFATFVLFAQEILDLNAPGFGILMTAMAAGGVLGSLAAARISHRLGSGASLLTTLGGVVVIGLIVGLTSSAAVVWAAMAIGSFLAVLWNVITVSLRQTIIPDHLLGRVNSVYRFFGWGMMPIGGLLGGVIVSVTEVVATRKIAIRMPFFVSAGVYLVLFVIALGRLTTARIEDSKAEAQVREGASPEEAR
ncbi:MAG: MFS transporter [Acidimicrobiia bacterium]